MTTDRSRVAEMLIAWRNDAGLSQNQLSALTFRLASEGKVRAGLLQQHVSRIEQDSIPTLPTMQILCTALAHALRDEGFEAADERLMLQSLENVARDKPKARAVSHEAVRLDAMLMNLSGVARERIWAFLFAGVQAYLNAYREQVWKARRERESDNKQQHD
jgi:transcriptional regulator with XRE-family HTH domain